LDDRHSDKRVEGPWPERAQRVEGFTLLELLIVIAVIAAVAAIATPGLLRARISGNEASAIASLRSIGTAEATFARSCGNGLFAGHLDVLGTAPSGQAPFISPDLGSATATVKSGYRFSLEGSGASGTACNGTSDLSSGYHAWADPVATTAGTRYFGTNTTNAIWESPASLSAMSDTDTPAGATPIH
jgi:type IV pilus assembly protein PilA